MKHTLPLWLWAGITNANAPTGKQETPVVIDADGTIRAGGKDEVPGETVAFIVGADDIALIPGDPQAVRKLFRWDGETVEGWAGTLEDLKVVVEGIVSTRCARRLARCLAHSARMESFINRPKTATSGDFLADLRQNSEKRFLAGEQDPSVVLEALRAEIDSIRRAALARGGETALAQLEEESSKMGSCSSGSNGEDFDDFDWEEEF